MPKRILVAPLNWGLGHATRCIPIIQALKKHNYEPIIASDGVALQLLKKEFPHETLIELPGYNITYSKKGAFFKLKLFGDSLKILKAIEAEKKAIQDIVKKYNVNAIISDNRLGVNCKEIPSIFITHQLQVLSGMTSSISTVLHNQFIKKFNACWVPDFKSEPNLSGKLGHPKTFQIPTTYLGPLSRFCQEKISKKYDLLVMLSGPEPQRTILEKLLFQQLNSYKGKVAFVRGVINEEQSVEMKGNITVCNYMTSELLQKTINQSALVLSRSGYTTVMDLAKLGKKAYFIPTPGQSEQEYLAKILQAKHLAPYCNQNKFRIEMLQEVENYKGLEIDKFDFNFEDLFSRFF